MISGKRATLMARVKTCQEAIMVKIQIVSSDEIWPQRGLMFIGRCNSKYARSRGARCLSGLHWAPLEPGIGINQGYKHLVPLGLCK